VDSLIKILMVLTLALNANATYLDSVDVTSNGSPVSNTNPLGVRLSDGTSYISTLPVSLASIPLASGAALASWQASSDATLSALNAKTPALGQALNAASVPVVLTASQLSTLTPLSSVSISGTPSVNVANASLAVTGAFFQATQPVSLASIPLASGAALASWQASADTTLSAINSKLAGTIATSVAGGATSALQTSGNSSLSTIASNTTGVSTAANQSTMITSLNTIAANTGAQSTDTIATGSISALNGAVLVNAQGAYTISANIAGTFVGTVVAEGQDASGVWNQLPMYIVQTTTPYPQTFTVTTPSTVLITGGGYASVRIRSSAFTSGTINVGLNASLAQQTIFSAQLGTWATKPVQVATYGASITGASFAVANTDVFTITGSATKTIKIKHISLDGTQTTAGVVGILLIKRSTANSGGTSTVVTSGPFDSTSAAATAVVRQYTANPTVGTPVATLHSEKVFVSTTTGQPDELKFDFSNLTGMQEITLRGTNEVLAINLNGVSVTGSSFNADITWTEE